MLLKALELHGFKSFPDKTVLRFSDGITAVVGPNGSGKSNISDAIRWVLGEQSSKSLRGSKMEDVIFNGTAQRRPMGYAEVTLVIDNTGRVLECDADEVQVTRRCYRSGGSEYRLNGATVRLEDIRLMFMNTGLGRDGYSIIGQGRIDEIVTSRSQNRREILDGPPALPNIGIKKIRQKTACEKPRIIWIACTIFCGNWRNVWVLWSNRPPRPGNSWNMPVRKRNWKSACGYAP